MIKQVVYIVCMLSAAMAAHSDNDAIFPNSPFRDVATESVAHMQNGVDPMFNNYVSIINSGNDALLLRIHLIRNSCRSIKIQTFIWKNDECGQLVLYELVRAAMRGVNVEVIVDQLMSENDPQLLAAVATIHPNLHVKYYRPPAKSSDASKLRTLPMALVFFRSTNQRMHNKIMLFDDAIAITGGRNFDNHYYSQSTNMNFIDRDALITGPLIPRIVESFEKYWKYRHSVSLDELRDVSRVIKRGDYEQFTISEDFPFDEQFGELNRNADDYGLIKEVFVNPLAKVNKVEFLADKPGKNKMKTVLGLWGGGAFTKRLKAAIKQTENTMIMQSPYLILGRRNRLMFYGMKKRNPELEVTISTNSFAATDNILAYSANYRLRPAYIEGLKFNVHELKPHPEDLLVHLPNHDKLKQRGREKMERGEEDREPFLCVHAKSFVLDDRISYIGTWNLDPRSDNLNTEVGLLIDDERIAAELKAEILEHIHPRNSWVIAKKEMPLNDLNQLVEGISGLSPIDIWPIRNTSSFELREGKKPVLVGHEDFYENYKDVGGFPETDGLSSKQILTHLYKVLGKSIIPVL